MHVLEHFQTDEYAHDSIAPEVIAVLKEEQSVAPSARPPLSDLSLGYRPPGEDVVLHKVRLLCVARCCTVVALFLRCCCSGSHLPVDVMVSMTVLLAVAGPLESSFRLGCGFSTGIPLVVLLVYASVVCCDITGALGIVLM